MLSSDAVIGPGTEFVANLVLINECTDTRLRIFVEGGSQKPTNLLLMIQAAECTKLTVG
jgi:hypothetical protein